jgi:hypothetical protein
VGKGAESPVRSVRGRVHSEKVARVASLHRLVLSVTGERLGGVVEFVTLRCVEVRGHRRGRGRENLDVTVEGAWVELDDVVERDADVG